MSEERVSSPRRRRLWRIGLVVAAVAALAAGGLKYRGSLWPSKVEASSSPSPTGKSDDKGKDKDKKEKEPVSVALASVQVGPISAYTLATANLVAEDEVKVLAEAEGKVVKLLVDEGHSVAKGQTLLQIDPADASIAVGKTELELKNAQLNLDRTEKMSDEKLVSTQDLDKVRFERDKAAQELAEARHRLKKTTVAAAFGGKITLRKVQPGQAVKIGEELFTLADFDPLIARIFLPEREVLDLKPGQAVRLSLRAREETRFAGRIRQISPVVDTASGTVKVTVEAADPPAGVRPGAFVSVEVLRETRPSALLVPKPAVIRELQESYVFVADGKTARRRAVQTGLEEGDRIEVTTGLKAGEQVVISGQGGLKDQAPIAVAPSPEPTKG